MLATISEFNTINAYFCQIVIQTSFTIIREFYTMFKSVREFNAKNAYFYQII